MQDVICQQRDGHARTKGVNNSMNVALSHVSSEIIKSNSLIILLLTRDRATAFMELFTVFVLELPQGVFRKHAKLLAA